MPLPDNKLESLMVKEPLTLITLGYAVYRSTQTTLPIPQPSGTQHFGAGCGRSAGESDARSSQNSAQAEQEEGSDARRVVPALERFDGQVVMPFSGPTLSKPVIMPGCTKTEFQSCVQ